MRILMVSPFPPLRDGVGKYAAQQVQSLREQGNDVEVLSPVSCAAHYVENLKGGLRLVKLRKYARRYDQIILQYQPSHYHQRGRGPSRLLTNLGMLLTFGTTPNLNVVCHEVDYPRSRRRLEIMVEKLAWERAVQVVFHTEREAKLLAERIGARPKSVTISPHGQHFRPASLESKWTARRRLGIADDILLLLCIGFIQPHKGFDRAVRAFRRVHSSNARLTVIGSVRVEVPENRNYMSSLRLLSSPDERIDVIETALSDEEFDRWIVASDFVVLPYRQIWSSGVFERAKLLNRPAIVSDEGGLAEQARSVDFVVRDDEELAATMARIVGTELGPEAKEEISPETAQALVIREAARRRLGSARASDGRERRPSVSEAVERLSWAYGVHAPVLPSRRRVIGPAVTVVKRILRKLLGWYVEPMVGRINEFEEAVLDAAASIGVELEALRSAVEALERKLNLPDE